MLDPVTSAIAVVQQLSICLLIDKRHSGGKVLYASFEKPPTHGPCSVRQKDITERQLFMHVQVRHNSTKWSFLVGLTCVRDTSWKGSHQQHALFGTEIDNLLTISTVLNDERVF